ncbi:MAG: hypothetical protein ACPG5T_09920, partial [Endozoicomonas sp.]
MKQVIRIASGFGFLLAITLLYRAWAEETVVEDASEFERLEVIFSTHTTGIIEAYKCRFCPAKVFYFDDELVIDNVKGASLFSSRPKTQPIENCRFYPE